MQLRAGVLKRGHGPARAVKRHSGWATTGRGQSELGFRGWADTLVSDGWRCWVATHDPAMALAPLYVSRDHALDRDAVAVACVEVDDEHPRGTPKPRSRLGLADVCRPHAASPSGSSTQTGSSCETGCCRCRSMTGPRRSKHGRAAEREHGWPTPAARAIPSRRIPYRWRTASPALGSMTAASRASSDWGEA